MSKIGRKPIIITSAKVAIKDKVVTLSGPKGNMTHELPSTLILKQEDGKLMLTLAASGRKLKEVWGLHRALLANKVKGVESGFEMGIKIVGLGYKAQLSGKKLVFSLGYSHKINYDIPEGVEVVVDRTGQNLVVKSIDKFLVGRTCDEIRAFRPPEPYKGTGIIREGEHVRRKAGKTKSAGA